MHDHDACSTNGPQVQDDIVRQLRLSKPLRLAASFNRPNLTYAVLLPDLPGSSPDWEALAALVAQHVGPRGESSLVCCRLPWWIGRPGTLLARHMGALRLSTWGPGGESVLSSFCKMSGLPCHAERCMVNSFLTAVGQDFADRALAQDLRQGGHLWATATQTRTGGHVQERVAPARPVCRNLAMLPPGRPHAGAKGCAIVYVHKRDDADSLTNRLSNQVRRHFDANLQYNTLLVHHFLCCCVAADATALKSDADPCLASSSWPTHCPTPPCPSRTFLIPRAWQVQAA